MNHIPRTLLAIVVATSSPALVQADDWLRFRGAGGHGVCEKVASIPLQLDEAKALWQIPLKGTGQSAPVIVGKKLFYTVSPEEKPGTRALVCVSTEDGKEIWRKSEAFANYKLHQFNSPTSSSPTVDAERVYLWWNDGDGAEVFALGHAGEPVWKQDLGPFESAHGSGSSLVLVDGVLLVQKVNLNESSFVGGLDPATGKVLWRTPIRETAKTSYVSPLIRALPGGGSEAIVASTEEGILALDPKSGEVRWKFNPAFEHRIVASPVACGDHLFVCAGGGGGGKDSVVLEVAPGSKQVIERHRLTKTIPYVPTGLGIDGKLFLVSDGGVATCVDPASGELVWRSRLVGKCFASPIAIGDRIYAFGRDGDYKVYRAADTFEVLAEGELSAGVNTTPAVADGKLFVRTDEKLLCFVERPEA